MALRVVDDGRSGSSFGSSSATHDDWPAAMSEARAAKFIHTNLTYFRDLVRRELIPHTTHGIRRIYLKEDLRAYLRGLPKSWGIKKQTSKPVTLKNPKDINHVSTQD